MIPGRRFHQDTKFVAEIDRRDHVKKKKRRLKSGVLSFYDAEDYNGRRREGVLLVNFKESAASSGLSSAAAANHLAKLNVTADPDQEQSVDYLLEYNDAIDEYATEESAVVDSMHRQGRGNAGDSTASPAQLSELEIALQEFFTTERKHPRNVSKRLASTVCKAMTRSSNLAKDIETFGLPPVDTQMTQGNIRNELKIVGYEEFLSPTIDLEYQLVLFVDKKSAFHRSILPKGRAILTSKRLLFLSTNEWKDKDLVFEKEKYKVVLNEGANAVYLPIPLSKIKSVEIVSAVKFESSAEFSQPKALLSSLFEYAFRSCLKRDTKRVEEDASAGQVHHKRFVQLGVKMPPWGEKTVINIRLAENADIQKAVTFVSGIQKNSPNLFGFDSDTDSSDSDSFTLSTTSESETESDSDALKGAKKSGKKISKKTKRKKDGKTKRKKDGKTKRKKDGKTKRKT